MVSPAKARINRNATPAEVGVTNPRRVNQHARRRLRRVGRLLPPASATGHSLVEQPAEPPTPAAPSLPGDRHDVQS